MRFLSKLSLRGAAGDAAIQRENSPEPRPQGISQGSGHGLLRRARNDPNGVRGSDPRVRQHRSP